MGAASKTSVITPEELIITEDKKDPGMVTHSCNSNTFQVDHTPTESHTPGILRQHKLALVVGSQGRIQSWLRREKGCGSGRVGGGRSQISTHPIIHIAGLSMVGKCSTTELYDSPYIIICVCLGIGSCLL